MRGPCAFCARPSVVAANGGAVEVCRRHAVEVEEDRYEVDPRLLPWAAGEGWL